MTALPFSAIGASSSVIGGTRSGIAVPQTRTLEFFDDFVHFEKASSATARWVDVGSGSGTTLSANGHGGLLQLTLPGSGEDAAEGVSTGRAIYLFSASKEMYVEVKFQPNAAAIVSKSMFFGLSEATAQGNANATILGTSNSHFGLSVINASISLSHGGGGATATTDTGADLAAATDVIMACHYDGKGTYRAYVDGVLGAVETTGGTSHPSDLMYLLLSIENNDNEAAAVGDVDYVYMKLAL